MPNDDPTTENERLEPWEIAWLAADAWFAKHGWFQPERNWTENSDDAPDYVKDFFAQVAAAVLKARKDAHAPTD
jgi:hypothetical protein